MTLGICAYVVPMQQDAAAAWEPSCMLNGTFPPNRLAIC
jgi:hypothetical protein